MYPILFITSGYRLDNFKALQKNLNDVVNSVEDYLNTKFSIYWYVCIDQTNSFGSLSIDYSLPIIPQIYYQESREKFDSEILNRCMREYESDHPSEDPYVMILDDDNWLSPFVLLKYHQISKLNLNKSIINFSMIWESGHSHLVTRDNYWSTKSSFDPSRTMIKLSLHKKYGYIHDISESHEGSYDFTYYYEIGCREISDVLFSNEVNHYYEGDNYHAKFFDAIECFHNAYPSRLEKLESIDKLSGFLNLCSWDYKDTSLGWITKVLDYNHVPQVIPINDELARKLLPIIIDYYNE